MLSFSNEHFTITNPSRFHSVSYAVLLCTSVGYQHVSSRVSVPEDGSLQCQLAECQRELGAVKSSLAGAVALEGRVSALEEDVKACRQLLQSLCRGKPWREGGEAETQDPVADLRMLDTDQVKGWCCGYTLLVKESLSLPVMLVE